MKSKTKVKRLLAGTIGALMFLSAVPAIPVHAATQTTVLTYDNFEVTYSVASEWTGGQNVVIDVKNLSEESIYNWAFKYDAGGSIEGLYNAAVFDNENTEYVLKNVNWNFEIAPQQSVSFGYIMHGEEFAVPSQFELCSERVEDTTGYEVSLENADSWSSGMRGDIVVTNTSDEPLEAWTLGFDTNFLIDHVWNGRIVESEDNHYVVSSEAWTEYIAPGESQTIGFVGYFDDEAEGEISNYSLSSVKIKGIEPAVEDDPSYQGEIDMNTDNIDLGYIETLIGENLITANFDENSEIRAIDGKFTNKPLNSIEDAVEILNCSKTLFGSKFSADSSNVSVQTSDGVTYYRLCTVLNGVPMLGSQVILSAKDGSATGLYNSYNKKAENISTAAALTEEAAVETVFNDIFSTYSDYVDAVVEYSGMEKEEVIEILKDSFEVDPFLCVYNYQSVPTLTWFVQIENNNDTYDENDEEIEIDYEDIYDYSKYIFNFINKQYYIYANGQNAGTIIRQADASAEGTSVLSSGSDLDLRGNTRKFSVDYTMLTVLGSQFPTYKMIDNDRNIKTYDLTFNAITKAPQLPGQIHSSSTNTWNDATNVTLHADMEEVYDFYKALGRDSYDNNHSVIKVTSRVKDEDWTLLGLIDIGSKSLKNAYWNGKQIAIGDLGNYAAAKDVLAHEFTHAVDQYVIYDSHGSKVTARGLEYYGESGALNEAYSDIMGMMAEGKSLSDPGRFTNAEDTGSIDRDYTSPGPKYADNYSALTDPTWSTTLNNYVNRDREGVHIFSTIGTHAVYLMMTDSRTAGITDETWSKVFYNSMFKLSTSSGFHDFRYAVISTAKYYGFTSDEQTAVKEAFDKVGITESNALRIVLEWGATPSDLDSHLTGPSVTGSGRFHVYYSQKNYYENGLYSTSNNDNFAAELDYDDTSSYGPEITTIHVFTPGDYYFYVHDYSNKYSIDSEALSASGVTVKIYQGSSNTLCKLDDGSNAQFTIPSPRSATLWKVFRITVDNSGNAVITKWDTYSNHSDPHSIGN